MTNDILFISKLRQAGSIICSIQVLIWLKVRDKLIEIKCLFGVVFGEVKTHHHTTWYKFIYIYTIFLCLLDDQFIWYAISNESTIQFNKHKKKMLFIIDMRWEYHMVNLSVDLIKRERWN